ncbi:exopolyphosphatase [Malassezia vespertilionis]|uniref:Ppx1p n=1 Tax=Malassezia vespertilionis TaxID=2020962 RepID=A0A2N1JFN1_9BASI|nr:exopolyphosphatase [Malassezia vespertilionis]PKI85352.1 Ppx1p [Malassezia vespertilionis]WFD04723.1 exopolyphosphatase [Malassezia vespertilionis]
MALSQLDAFLRTRKGLTEKGGTHWVVGNEAGDMDSVACAIGFAYLSVFVNPSGPQWIPVVQTNRADLALRPENLLALHQAGIDAGSLCCLDDVHGFGDESQVILVDHNQVSGIFEKAHVVGIIDHHWDEQKHTNVPMRLICSPEYASSCASVLSLYFEPQLPKSPPLVRAVADLLLSAIFLDTSGLSDENDRTMKVDRMAADFLIKHSSFTNKEARTAYFQQLATAKSDTSQLTINQKLRRDYKAFKAKGSGSSTWAIGTASITEPLPAFLTDNVAEALTELQCFATKRALHLLFVLAGFVDAEGNSHRQLLCFSPSAEHNAQALGEALGAYREQKVDLVPLGLNKPSQLPNVYYAAWEQRDESVTRKQFIPIIQTLCATMENK